MPMTRKSYLQPFVQISNLFEMRRQSLEIVFDVGEYLPVGLE